MSQNNRKPRILYVFNVSWFFLSHRRSFALAAKRVGYDVHVAASLQSGDAEQISSDGLIFHPLPLTRQGLNIFNEFKTICTLFYLYNKIRPNIIEHATIKPVIYGSLIAKCFKQIKIVNWMTGLGYVFISNTFRGGFIRILARFLYRYSFKNNYLKVIFENPDDQSYFTKHSYVKIENTHVIRGAGVNPKIFSPLPELHGVLTIILISRMLWDKGVSEFIEAARIIKGKLSMRSRFVLVGDSDEGNPAAVPNITLESWVSESVVEWWGRRNDIPQVIGLSHIVCLPSYREGLPKVLIEAASCERAIVATDVPGCREVVKHGVNGLLVPPKNALALANAIQYLIENPDIRCKMGKNGRKMVIEEFSENKVVTETLAVYQELLSR